MTRDQRLCWGRFGIVATILLAWAVALLVVFAQ
jgi:hypothetical protein